jgi:transposase-like protein
MWITDEDIAEFIKNSNKLLLFCRKASQLLLEELLRREAQEFIAQFDGEILPNGQKRVVLNGSYPRTLLTSVGDVNFQIARVHFRAGEEQDKPKFKPSIIPKYLRKTEEMVELIAFLYLTGISTTQLPDVLGKMFGMEIKGLSPKTISALFASWTDDYKDWSKRDLTNSLEYPYVFVDGIFFPIRGHKDHQVLLALIGVHSEGEKELLALDCAISESTERWKALFLDLRERGLKSPMLVVGDGAMGLWRGLRAGYPNCSG